MTMWKVSPAAINSVSRCIVLLLTVTGRVRQSISKIDNLRNANPLIDRKDQEA